MSENKPTTLRDIAERTGVSVMTVQRVIGSPHLVAEKTRNRILKVMQDLGYIPNRNASSLVSQSTGFLGLVVSSVTSPTFAGEIDGVAEFGLTTGRELLLAQTNYDPSREYDVVRAMLGRRPDGLILTFSPSERRTRQLLKGAAIPIVETWDDPARPVDMVSGFSNQDAARKIARHFAQAGRKQPAFFAQLIGRDVTRWSAFADECEKLMGIAPLHIPVGSGDSITEERFSSGPSFFDQVADSSIKPDCVFCGSDLTAAAIIFEAQRRGINVPGDLAVCGFGDLDFAASTVPSLTTIRVPAYEMGRRAGELILAKLTSRPGPRQVLLETELMVRESA